VASQTIPAVDADVGVEGTSRSRHIPTRRVEAVQGSQSKSLVSRQPAVSVNFAFASAQSSSIPSLGNRLSSAFTNRQHLRLRWESEPDLAQIVDEVEAMRYRIYESTAYERRVERPPMSSLARACLERRYPQNIHNSSKRVND
jgi:hypothetical protein